MDITNVTTDGASFENVGKVKYLEYRDNPYGLPICKEADLMIIICIFAIQWLGKLALTTLSTNYKINFAKYRVAIFNRCDQE